MFGISSFCLHREPLEVALETLSPLTDLVEIMDDGPHFVNSIEPLESFSFRYAFHAPSRSVNVASILEPIRKASVEVIGQCFSLAGEMGSCVVIHPGYFTWEQEREHALRQFRKSFTELNDLSEEHGVTYYIENMGDWDYFFLRTPDDLELIDGVGLALDVGHANLNNCLDEFLTHPIRHVHLHDNNGKEDSHSAVGEGTIDFSAVMQAVDRDGAVPVVEVATLEGTLQSIRILERLETG